VALGHVTTAAGASACRITSVAVVFSQTLRSHAAATVAAGARPWNAFLVWQIQHAAKGCALVHAMKAAVNATAKAQPAKCAAISAVSASAPTRAAKPGAAQHASTIHAAATHAALTESLLALEPRCCG